MMKRKRLAILLAMAMLLSLCNNVVFAGTKENVTFYVSNEGDDTAAGTEEAKPLATLQQALKRTTDSAIQYTICIQDDITYGTNWQFNREYDTDVTIRGKADANGKLPTITINPMAFYFIQEVGSLTLKDVIIDCKAVVNNYDAIFQIDEAVEIRIENVKVINGEKARFLRLSYKTKGYIVDSEISGEVNVADYAKLYLSGQVKIEPIKNTTADNAIYIAGKLAQDSQISFGTMKAPAQVSGDPNPYKDKFLEDIKDEAGAYSYLTEEDLTKFKMTDSEKRENYTFYLKQEDANAPHILYYMDSAKEATACELKEFTIAHNKYWRGNPEGSYTVYLNCAPQDLKEVS